MILAVPRRMYAVKSPAGILWTFSARPSRKEALECGAEAMSINDFERLGTLTARWRFQYRRGYRVVRCELRELP